MLKLITDRKWVRPGGKLSYPIVTENGVSGPNFLNLNRKSGERVSFHGFYENDIPVAIERILMSHGENRKLDLEMKRDVYILKGLGTHENFIRYFTYETDIANNFA